MKIEVFNIEDCPNRQPTVERVKVLFHEFGFRENVLEIPVTEAAAAIAVRFLGSPTIHVNGVDIEPTARTSCQFGVMCRMDLDGSKQEGVPSVALIRHALLEAQSGAHRFAMLK